MKPKRLLALSVFLPCIVFAAEPEVKQYAPTGSLPYLSVEESLKTFHLPEGYRLEAVVAEPEIVEPVVCAFDGNGRLYVVEMRTYMQDADATGEAEPTSRVSLHEDTDGDGKMDRHSVFVDGLLLPRMVLPLDDRVLINETNTLDIYSYRDTDGDGVSDEKTLWYEGGPRGGNMEHQPSGLIWTIDNWIYTTYNSYRLRHNPDGLAHKESTGSNGGQWGLAQDDHGKPWFTNAGGELGPLNFQQPILYGRFSALAQFPVEFREVFPLVGIPDVQGGTKRFRPADNTLNHFTATCGQEIFRGDRLPQELRGDLLFSEPVGRLIRRADVEVRDGITYLKNAHPGSEFIRSTDPNFRAMHMTTGPDGCLYIVDMYRGIIQQGNWTKPNSYLRGVIDEYGFAKNVGRGRIYRLVHNDFEPDRTRPKMLEEKPAELVAHLDHPNGWWRDNAQKQLILRGDHSVAPAVKRVASENEFDLARMHAIWTLEGLGKLTPDFVRTKFSDAGASVRRAAIRASETLIKSGDESLRADILALASDPNPDVVIQVLLTADLLDFPGHKDFIAETATKSESAGVKLIAKQLLEGSAPVPPKLTPEQLSLYKEGEQIYASLCFACHGPDGTGTQIPGGDDLRLAPSLTKSEILQGHPDLAIKVLLHGLTGPVEGKTYPGEMIAMESNGDEWVAAVLSYVRNSFGNQLGFLTEADVKELRQENADRTSPWTEPELLASVPQILTNRGAWKITANVKEKEAKYAIDGDAGTRFSTGSSMQPGMWVEVELPEITEIAGIILDAGRSKGDYPRGCEVQFSEDGETWSKPVKKKEEKDPRTVVEFSPRTAKHIRVTQTGKHRLHWSIHELHILESPE